jgi:hypothetical protein
MNSRNMLILFFALNIFLIGNSNAAIIANLSFITPTGTVSPTASIEVWVRLSLDPQSDPFTFDKSLGPTAGAPTSLIPTEGVVYDPLYYTYTPGLFDTYIDAGIGTGYDYQYNNFINDCNSSSCGYNYYTRDYLPNSVRELEDKSFTLNPGESLDVMHGYFIPRNDGTASPNTYTLYNLTLSLWNYGLTSEGESISGYTVFAETCPTRDASCAFTRTVSAVPVPAAVYLFSSGLIILFGMTRRKHHSF